MLEEIVRRTLYEYGVICTVYSVHRTLYGVQCTPYTVRCAVTHMLVVSYAINAKKLYDTM